MTSVARISSKHLRICLSRSMASFGMMLPILVTHLLIYAGCVSVSDTICRQAATVLLWTNTAFWTGDVVETTGCYVSFFHTIKLSAETRLVNSYVTTYTDRMTTRHAPNFAWSQPLDESMLGAACLDHRDLPWTADTAPHSPTLQHMREVCEGCPVLLKCAERALRGRGAGGGMYAGVWLPWGSDNATKKIERRQAIRILRLLLKEARPAE